MSGGDGGFLEVSSTAAVMAIGIAAMLGAVLLGSLIGGLRGRPVAPGTRQSSATAADRLDSAATIGKPATTAAPGKAAMPATAGKPAQRLPTIRVRRRAVAAAILLVLVAAAPIAPARKTRVVSLVPPIVSLGQSKDRIRAGARRFVARGGRERDLGDALAYFHSRGGLVTRIFIGLGGAPPEATEIWYSFRRLPGLASKTRSQGFEAIRKSWPGVYTHRTYRHMDLLVGDTREMHIESGLMHDRDAHLFMILRAKGPARSSGRSAALATVLQPVW